MREALKSTEKGVVLEDRTPKWEEEQRMSNVFLNYTTRLNLKGNSVDDVNGHKRKLSRCLIQ